MLLMSTSAARRRYHHGNLREALLKAAIELVGEAGPAGFTLREAARRAGVSHNAPYRHFRDKGELLAAVATEGFRELTLAMREAAARQATAVDQLKQAGLAYIAFALRRPDHFIVMFEAPLPEIRAGREAFETLRHFVEACQREGDLPAGDPLPRALMAWSLVHGIARLAIAGRLPFRSRREILRFAEAAMAASP